MMKNQIKILALSAMAVLTAACENDDPVTPQTGGVFICTTVPSPDGMSGSAYMRLIQDMSEASYDNSNSIPTSYTVPPIIRGENIFDMPAGSNESNTIKKYTFEGGVLQLKGSLVAPANSMPIDIETKDSKGYIALRGVGQILVINHESMTTVKTIDITTYGIGDQNPDPTCLLIRDNYLFVALQQIQGGYIPNPERPAVDILVIDLETEEPVKMITDDTSGMTWPASGIDQNSLFMDDDKNIYVSCFGGMTMSKSGFLRIKNGETEFDKDYRFILSDISIAGESNKLNYLSSVVYYKNNKAYGVANIPAYFSNPSAPDYFHDRFSLPVEIDLSAKTMKSVGLPRSNGYGVVSGIYNNLIVFGLATDNDNGFYTYDAVMGKGSENAVVRVTGYPYKFYQFK